MARKTKVITDAAKIDEILSRGVITEILPSMDGFRQLLLSGKRLRMYLGADPTSPVLHLSHAKNYLLLEELRKLGHEVFVLIGSFTAMIGDPSDRESARARLTKDEIKKNVASWKKQIGLLMDLDAKENPPKFVFNDKWLSKLTLEDLVDLASNVTVQHMLERDMFEKRLENNKPIFLHEFFYPLMQGYDSVELDVDVELCGTDQIFNALMGRTLLRKYKNKDKFVVAVNLMANPRTGDLMSKSRGTGVFLNETPKDMYGSIMSQPDEMIPVLLLNNTRLSKTEIDSIILTLSPRDAKMRTAFEIIGLLHGKKKAEEAQEAFIQTFQNKEIPTDIKEIHVDDIVELEDVVHEHKLLQSKSEFRRLIQGGGVRDMETGEKILDPKKRILIPLTLKLGKKNFIRIIVRKKKK